MYIPKVSNDSSNAFLLLCKEAKVNEFNNLPIKGGFFPFSVVYKPFDVLYNIIQYFHSGGIHPFLD